MDKNFENIYGIDVSKNWLDISIDRKSFNIDQTLPAIKHFFRDKIQTPEKTLIVLESTGGYEKLVKHYLVDQGITVHVAHPNKVKSFARAKGKLAKTDKIDAHLLSEYGKFIDGKEIRQNADKNQEELRTLGTRIEQLKQMHHQESCRLGMVFSNAQVKRSIEKMLKILKASIKAIEDEILEKISLDATLKEKYDLLLSMKGVGKTLAMSLIIDLPELGEANKKEIAALTGVAPITTQSGQKGARGRIKYGREGIRKILFMCALTACRYVPKFKAFYTKLIDAGKAKKVAIVAVMRRIIVILNAMVRTKTHFSS